MRSRSILAVALTIGFGGTMALVTPWRQVQAAESQVLIGASDIGVCGADKKHDDDTAALLAAAPSNATIFTAGDNSQENGSSLDYYTRADCFGGSWGVEEDARKLKSRIRPAPGNHDYYNAAYRTDNADNYFTYFGAQAGDPGKGYYSYELGTDWHIVSLNSNCSGRGVGGCAANSNQWNWLKTDLDRNSRKCTVAYLHAPMFTSGSRHAPQRNPRTEDDIVPLFQQLYEHDAEMLISGHNHQYERFVPGDPVGVGDDEKTSAQLEQNGYGIRQFVVGTGGAELIGFDEARWRADTKMPKSEVQIPNAFGVLKLTLMDYTPGDGTPDYRWEFLPTGGGAALDSGTGNCH